MQQPIQGTESHALRGIKRFHTSAGAVGNEVWLRALDLDERALLAEARRRTHLEDFAEDETFHEALGRLIRSYETEANLNPIGRVATRQDASRRRACRTCS